MNIVGFNLDQFDQTYQDVKEFEDHPVCSRLGWDAGILRALIDASFMGGMFSRKDRVYVTTERYLVQAAIERTKAVRTRLAQDEQLSGLEDFLGNSD